MSTREPKHYVESMMIRIAISVATFLILLVTPVAAIQDQTDGTHDATPVTTAFHYQLDALNEKLADIPARPVPTTADLLSSSTVFGTVFPHGVNLPPEGPIVTVIFASTLLALGLLTLLTLRL